MQNFEWHVLKSEYLVQNEWVSLRADTCQMPNGALLDPYYIVESGSYVNIVPVTPEGEVVMVRLYRHGPKLTLLETPGGLIDPGEAVITSARRELLEETGYDSEQIELIGSGYPDPARLSCRAYYFLARDATQQTAPQHESTEQMEILRVPLKEVVALLLNGRIHDAVQQSALFYALVHLGYWQAA